jgi:hypothetical protein
MHLSIYLNIYLHFFLSIYLYAHTRVLAFALASRGLPLQALPHAAARAQPGPLPAGGSARTSPAPDLTRVERETKSFVDDLLVQINFTIEMIWWTGLALWVFESHFPGFLISTFPS